ncbi:hypothetical protein AUC31_01810 [Planococcus rifietoensis]|uniref:MFS transporter n=1 Tax=Planococcus rifietoensis TaxID=200991 RepID=A0A0U2XDJ0_9BACL|nr:MFS transporter [Planococcus rifietoensis]ALS74064.1 hypothetical protein AUC31_01810 [Planococcus rifietoensis]
MYRHVLKNKNILYYLAGAGISQLGNVLAGLAFLFISYELTESAALTTIIAISQAMPYLLFGLIGGACADRVNKKRMLVAIDLLRIPLILSLVVLFQLDILAFWHLLAAAFTVQTLGCFYNPAYRAVLPLITPIEQQTTVNSLLDTVTRGVQVVTPLFAIGLLNAGHAIHFYTIDAMTYLASALLILKIHWVVPIDQENMNETKRDGLFYSIGVFFWWAKREGTVTHLFFATFWMVFFNTWVWQVGLLLLLLDRFPGSGQEIYSLLLGWYGFGVILTNIAIPFFWKTLTFSLYLWGSIVWGLGLVVLGFASYPPLYIAGVFIAAAGLPLSSLARVYLIQTLVPADMLGRAFSFNAVLLYGSNILSLAIFGALASVIGIQKLFIWCGSLMVITAIFYLFRALLTENTRRKAVKALE